MPGISGFEVLSQCRLTPHLTKLPIVMVIAEADRKNLFSVLKAGATDYSLKHCNADNTAHKIKHLNETAAKKAASMADSPPRINNDRFAEEVISSVAFAFT